MKIAILVGLAIAAGVVSAAPPVTAPDGTVLDDALTADAGNGRVWVRVGLSTPLELAPDHLGNVSLPRLQTARLVVLDAVSHKPIAAGSMTWRLSKAPADLRQASWQARDGQLDISCAGDEAVQISSPGYASTIERLQGDGRRHTVLLRPTGTLAVELQPATKGHLWLAREDRINVANLFVSVSEKHPITAAGTLEVSDLDSKASYLGVAIAPGSAPVVTRFQGLPQSLSLPLDEAFEVSGTVVDEHGDPLPGAEIEAVGAISDLDSFPYTQRGVSDGEGLFHVTGLLPGKILVRACADGRACSESRIELTEDSEERPLRLQLAPGQDLQIMVENEVGDSVNKAMVFFEGRAHYTDTHGRLEIRGIVPGQTIPVKVFGDGFGVWEGSFTTDRKRVVLRVPGGAVIEQQVLTARRFEEDEVVVRWQSFDPKGREGKSGAGSWDPEHQIARVSGLEAGTYELNVRLTGSATLVSERVDVVPGEEVVLAPVMPERGLAISGRVLDGMTFQPVAGAEVRCEPGSPTVFRPLHQIENVPSTSTDTDGVFILEGLDQGSCRAIVRAAGFATWRKDDVEPDEFGFDLGDIEMDAGMTVVGRVTDRADRPITGVQVEITEAAAYAYFPEMAVRTNHDGWYRAERLPVGRWKVSAEHNEATARATVEGRPRDTVTANLVLGGMQIEGEIWLGDTRASGGTLVLTTNASQATGVVVMFDRVTAGRRFFGVDATPIQLPVTTAGLFASTGIEPGRYYASYTPIGPGAAPMTQVLDIPHVETFNCVLQYADASVQGVVVDVDNLPVVGASVVASTADGTPETNAFTDVDGRFSVRGLEPGRVVLTASRTGFGPSLPTEVELRDGRTEGPVVLELLEPDGAEIVLTVHASSGSVGGAPVYLVGADTATSFTDGNGLATFSDVAAGPYRPCGIAFGGATGCGEDLRVDDGDQLQASLELGRGGFVDVFFGTDKRLPAITVTTRDGVDLSSLLFMASPPQPLPGGARIGPLQADDYIVTVSATGGPRRGQVSIREGEPVDLDLR
jgi:protocatechuate 3,4-dioxygenase beta subunit